MQTLVVRSHSWSMRTPPLNVDHSEYSEDEMLVLKFYAFIISLPSNTTYFGVFWFIFQIGFFIR